MVEKNNNFQNSLNENSMNSQYFNLENSIYTTPDKCIVDECRNLADRNVQKGNYKDLYAISKNETHDGVSTFAMNKGKLKYCKALFASNYGRWTAEEKYLFMKGVIKFGLNWKKIEDLVHTRTAIQLKSHGQKVFSKIGSLYHTKDPIDYIMNHPYDFISETPIESNCLKRKSTEITETENPLDLKVVLKIQDFSRFDQDKVNDNLNQLNFNEIEMKIKNSFFESLEDSEGMKRINSFLQSILKEIKENKNKFYHIICLYAIKKVASNWIIWEKISPKIRKFLKRLFKVVRHYLFLIEKEYNYKFSKDYCFTSNECEFLQLQERFESMFTNTSFSIGNPLKLYKLKSLIF